MAIIYSDCQKTSLAPKSWRELKYYQKRITETLGHRLSNHNRRDFREQVDELNALRLSATATKELNSSFLQDQLGNEDFNIIGDERMCYWVWCFINHHSHPTLQDPLTNEDVEQLIPKNKGEFTHSQFSFFLSNECIKQSPGNTASALEQIQSAFNFGEYFLEEQKEVLEAIVVYWAEIFEKNKFIMWLEKDNHEQIEWAWNYINNSEYGLAESWAPTGNNDRYHALIAKIDYNWFVYYAELSDTMRRMKSAWAQKKFRDKTAGTKAYSVSMTEHTKTQLTWLVEKEASTIHSVIKELINEKYEKMGGPESKSKSK